MMNAFREMTPRDKVDTVLLIASFCVLVYWTRFSIRNQKEMADESRLTHATIRGSHDDF